MARHSEMTGNILDPRVIILFVIIVAFAWLVSVALTAAMYGPPLILLCGLLYNELRGNQRQTLLSSDETRNLTAYEDELRGINCRLEEIEEEGSHLKQNIDGSYHRGSKLGMALNNERDTLRNRERILAHYTRYLRCKPLGLLDRWIHIESLRVG